MLLFKLSRYIKCKSILDNRGADLAEYEVYLNFKYYINSILINNGDSLNGDCNDTSITFNISKKSIKIISKTSSRNISGIESVSRKFLSAKPTERKKPIIYEISNNNYNFVCPINAREGIIIQNHHHKVLVIVRPYKERYKCANAYIYLNDVSLYLTKYTLDEVGQLLGSCHMYNLYMIKNKKAILVRHYNC